MKDQLEQLVKVYETAAKDRKSYDVRRAYARCAADLRFLLNGGLLFSLLSLEEKQ